MSQADPRIPIQTPLLDDRGNLTRPWILYLQGLSSASGSGSSHQHRISFLDYIPKRLHGSIRAGNCDEPLQVYMQNAIDALRTLGGGMIDLPGGIYPLGDGDGIVLTENATIMGDGDIRSIITYSGNGTAVQLGDNTRLRIRMGLRDIGVTLKGAGQDAVGVKVISALIINLRNVAVETDQPFVAVDDDEFHSAFNQVGMLWHGGTWGSIRGLVSISGSDLTWVAGDKFGPWFTPGTPLYFGGDYSSPPVYVAAYIDDEHITLTTAPGDTAEVQYLATLHGFSAFIYWQDCFIRGLFKKGLHITGDRGWGITSSYIHGGGVIWNYPISPPSGKGYYGVHLEIGTFLANILNVENNDVCMKLEDRAELVLPRFEGYRSTALWIAEPGPPNVSIDGEKKYSAYVVGDLVQVFNTPSAGILTDAMIGQEIIIDRAGAGYGLHTTTITAVNPNGISCTIADPVLYYSLFETQGGRLTRIWSGTAYSAQGGLRIDDDTGGEYSAIGTDLTDVNLQNNLIAGTALRGPVDIAGNYSLTWTEVGGSSTARWMEGGLATAIVGVFGDRKLNLYAGVVLCEECGADITSGSNVIELTVYPGQVQAVEPDASVIGHRIVIEKGVDSQTPLDTTITDVTATPATWTQGSINITTTTVFDENGEEVASTQLDGNGTAWTIALSGKTITIDGEDYLFVYAAPDRGFIDQSTPYEEADSVGTAYSIAYETYELELADNVTNTVSGVFVRFGAEEDWSGERNKDIVLKARGSVRFQRGNVEGLTVDSGGVAVHAPVRIYGNQGLSWSTLGASAGLNWNLPDPTTGAPINYGAVANHDGYLNVRAGAAEADQDLLLEVVHEDSEIHFIVDGETKLLINADGVQGLVSLAVTGNNSFTNLTASEWVKVENNAAPLLILRQTHASTRTQGLDLGWGGYRQWLVGTGVPSGGVEALTITEYDDDVFDAVRLMVFKGGNVSIGTTVDDGSKLFVNGKLSVYGDLVVSGVVPALNMSSATPFLVVRNSTSSKVGGMDLGWGGYRQWLFSAGVPSSSMTAFALTEYTDDVYDGVRWMIFKGGNMVVGATTDDGVNKLQVNGSLTVTDASTTRTNLGVDAAPTVTPGSVTLLKLTGGGSDGSLTISATGRITAYSAPT